MNSNRKGSLWIHCPICGGKTRTKVYEDTVLVKFPLYCPKCKKPVRTGIKVDGDKKVRVAKKTGKVID